MNRAVACQVAAQVVASARWLWFAPGLARACSQCIGDLIERTSYWSLASQISDAMRPVTRSRR
ncbi:MAG: hypothetical protein AW12_02253 [Candidatus Accumulibacter sp. BA-94]|nr:MAG: hypothetical protein AW12_02253 [Candidatus Accumulibacter sp. BA-94]